MSLFGGSAQEYEESKFVEFFTLHPNRHKLDLDSTLYPSKLILAPIISFSPETSLGFGIGSKFLFKRPGSGSDTRTSNMPISIQYTLENQFIVSSGFEIFSPGEKWQLSGNAKFQNFPRLYYGIGRSTPETNEEQYEFNQVLLEPILLKNIFVKYLFVGAGVRFNRVGGVELENENGLLANTRIPGARGSTSVGTEFAFVYDSRSNILNAQSGWYVEFTVGHYNKGFGSDYNFELTRLDLRKYWNLSSRNYDVFALQLKTHFASEGAPLAELAFFGSEEIMRGFYEGRFIEKSMVAFQAEYRRNLFGRLGVVFFVGAGDVEDDIGDFKLRRFRPSAGFGLRFLLDKRENLNLRFDWGFAKGNNNYYLNIAEAF